MLAAERLGISVPGDLSIVGIDGHEYAEMFGLTTVEQYPGEQGRLAVELVMALLGEVGASAGTLEALAPLPVRLVVRSSTTAAAR
jgi:DNA-binding LacI/PurR family transcriptional regulator